MLRDTYAIRFLQAGGELAALQEQLGAADRASVKRYQHFYEQWRQEQEIQACSEESVFTQQSRPDKSKRRKEQDRGEVADALREKRAVFGEPLTVEK